MSWPSRSAAQLLDEDGSRLRNLRGKTLVGYFALWSVGEDRWFADEAIVLDFGFDQLEVRAHKTHLWIAFGPVALHERLDLWMSSCSSWLLAWRQDVIAALNPLVGRPLESLTLVESLLYREVEALGFGSGSSYCELYNGLDELGATDIGLSGPGRKRIRVWES